MPSKKPIIHFNTDQWLIDKMKIIASENNRSLAKEMEHLCKLRIKEYELENGEISLEDSKEIEFESFMNSVCDKFYDDILKKSEKAKTTPQEWWNNYLEKKTDKRKNSAEFQIIKKYVEKRLSEE